MDHPDSPELAATVAEVLALVGDAIIGTDGQGRILLFNKAAEETFGHAAAEVIGSPLETLIPARFRAAHAQEVDAFAAETGAARRVMGHRREVLGLRKNGEEFPVEATVSRQQYGGREILTAVVRDVSERRRLEASLERQRLALQTNENRLRLALLGGRMGAWDVNLATNELVCDPAARELWGLPPTGPLSVRDVIARVHPDDRRDFRAELEETIGEQRDHRFELRIVHPDGSVRWVASKGAILQGPDGGAKAMLGVTFDVTERRRLEEVRHLHAVELNHRMKNQMALVGSVVALTARGAESVEAYRSSLQGRLAAIAETQGLPVVDDGRRTTLRDQLLAELGPYRNVHGTNVALDGPDIALEPDAAAAIRLVLHELTTNAAKYGALSAPTGRVDVTWRTEVAPEGRQFGLEWSETGGPPVSSPARRGFGTTLIERAVGRSSGGDVQMDYPPEGFRCRISLPMAARGAR